MRKYINIVEGVVDFTKAKANMRPTAPIAIDLSESPDLFEELWMLIVENAGPTPGTYREALVAAMEEARSRGNRTIMVIPAVMSYLIGFVQDATDLDGSSYAAKLQARALLDRLK